MHFTIKMRTRSKMKLLGRRGRRKSGRKWGLSRLLRLWTVVVPTSRLGFANESLVAHAHARLASTQGHLSLFLRSLAQRGTSRGWIPFSTRTTGVHGSGGGRRGSQCHHGGKEGNGNGSELHLGKGWSWRVKGVKGVKGVKEVMMMISQRNYEKKT